MGDVKVIPSHLADPELLAKIDKLFACGVGDYVALPQIIVVGDQSSGKSSVLEGLTELPFPRDSGLCTRFATQITFRRAKETSISVTIIPALNASQEHIETIQTWSKHDFKTLDPEIFSGIMKEVHVVMGLGDQQGSGGKGSFSEDVLKLEISGPTQEHLSVVDVPGIFRKTTEGVTTTVDKNMVQAMVRRYMENPRSVMLTVIPANVDIATQEILTMAEEVDPKGQRTLGVLTKPDLVDKGAEVSVLELIEGKKHKLNLGWCLVRNPGQKQLLNNDVGRIDIEEGFFRTEKPWDSLNKERVGISALRILLQEILATHIRREFPKVKSEISKKLTVSKQALKKLGSKRETAEEQRKYLLLISMRFQEIVALALSANYVRSDWFDEEPSLRFATKVVNRSELLSTTLEKFGHLYDFNAVNQDLTQTEDEVGYPEEEMYETENTGETVSVDESENMEEDPNDCIRLRTTTDHDELDEAMFAKKEMSKAIAGNTVEWLTTVYKNSRGFELGTFDSSILAMTMKTQSSKWEALALGYISDIVSMTHTFIKKLLQLTCPNARTQSGIMSVLMEGLMAKYQKAFDHTMFLLYVERMGTPATLNHYFNDNLEKSRQARMRATMNSKSFELGGHGTVVRLDDVVQNHPMSNVQHIVRDIHDILKAYYKVARKRFVDNMCMQASDYHLVTGPNTPLLLFSPSFVQDLTTDQLEEIAGEESGVKRERRALRKEIDDLEAGRKILF